MIAVTLKHIWNKTTCNFENFLVHGIANPSEKIAWQITLVIKFASFL